MPIVPVVNQNPTNTPDVQGPSVAPMRNAAPDQLRETGATLQQAGLREMSVGQQINLRIQEQEDNANVKAAEGKFIQAASEILNGDNGYMQKEGVDALNGYQGAADAITKAKKDILDSLGNDVQKRIFNNVSQQHLVTFGARMSEHRAQQRRVYSANESLSRAENMRSMVQNSDLGSDDHAKYISAGVAEVRNALAVKGIPADSEEAKKAERDYRTSIVGDDVTRLMTDSKWDEAKNLLNEEVKAGNVDPQAADQMRKAIRANVDRVDAINTADKIFASRKGLDAADLEELLVKVDAVKDPEMRQHVRSLVTSQFTQARSIQEQKYNDNLKDVVNFKYENNGSLKGIDPVKWGMLDAKDRFELSKPPAVETDLNTWYKFVTQPDTLTLDNVKAAFVSGKLSQGDFKGFTERAMTLANQKDYVQEAGGINERINYFANQAGLNIYGPNIGPEDKIAHGQLVYAVQNEIDRVKAANKGKVTSDQVDQIIKKELTQQTLNIPRSPWNPLAIIGYPNRQEKKFTFTLPQGATMVVPGSDGKMHYSDGTNDLGVVE